MKKTWIFIFIAFAMCCEGKIVAEEKLLAKVTQEETREKLLTLLSGEWVSRGLYVVTKLDIAHHLQNEPKSVAELAKLTSSNSDSLYRLLHMLAGFGNL